MEDEVTGCPSALCEERREEYNRASREDAFTDVLPVTIYASRPINERDFILCGSIVFRAITQMLAMCQERKRQKSSLMQTRKERIAACVAELQNLEKQQERHKQEKLRT